MLSYINILSYATESGAQFNNLQISYQLFGKKLGTAPVVLVNHALTGNSNVAGEQGWWNNLIGKNKTIDINRFTVLAFNIPGNGYDGLLIESYKSFTAKDVAKLFLLALDQLKIKELFAILGGSLGGGLAWEMAIIQNNIAKHIIPVAADWKSTDWLIANCLIQEQILQNSSNPVHDARTHAMILYRTPQSFKSRFNRTVNKFYDIFNVESWLLHHGKKLQERFQLSAYKMMNHLLKTINACDTNKWADELKNIKSQIHIVGIDSDLFFTAQENKETYLELKKRKTNVNYHEIKSIHGHDAFLIEYKQLDKILQPIFQ